VVAGLDGHQMALQGRAGAAWALLPWDLFALDAYLPSLLQCLLRRCGGGIEIRRSRIFFPYGDGATGIGISRPWPTAQSHGNGFARLAFGWWALTFIPGSPGSLLVFPLCTTHYHHSGCDGLFGFAEVISAWKSRGNANS